MTGLLEEELRATLSAHAGEVLVSRHLADHARGEAVRLRRRQRTQALAGVAVLAGVVAVIPWLSTPGSPDRSLPPVTQPTPSPTGSELVWTGRDVPETVLALARETGALVASGNTIVDGATVVQLPTNVEVDVESGDTTSLTISALSRAAGGYVSATGPRTVGEASAFDISYVRRDGSVTPLGTSLVGDRVAVSPDGLLVAFADASGGWEGPSIRVVELSGRVVAQRSLPQLGTPMAVDAKGVWYSLAVDPGTAPYYWDLTGGGRRTTQLAIASTSVLAAVHGDQMVVDDYGEDGCQHGLDVSDPTVPVPLWFDCRNANLASYSPTGDDVATIVTPPGGGSSVVAVHAARTGEVLAETRVPGVPGLQMQWTADGQTVILAGCCSDDGDSLWAVALVGSLDAPRLEATDYGPVPVDASVVVVGVELPLPPAGA